MTWFGETAEDRRRSFGLIGMALVLSPLILLAEALHALGVPCRADREVTPWT